MPSAKQIVMSLGLCACTFTSAQAAIVSTVGNVSVVAPPATVDIQQNEGLLSIVFPERLNYALTSGAKFDVDGTPGTYNDTADFTGVDGFFASGTQVDVNSYFVHFDSPGGTTISTAAITFDQPIIALMLQSSRLSTSDNDLGAPGTTYPIFSSTGVGRRGIDFSDAVVLDSVTISDDRRTLSYTLTSSNSVDQIRVLTSVPEPGTLGLVGISGLALLRRRR